MTSFKPISIAVLTRIIGDNIGLLRHKKKMNRDVLAEKSGVSKSTIFNIESGKPINLDRLVNIANALLEPTAGVEPTTR